MNIGDGDYLEPMHAARLDQVVAPRHGSVFFQNSQMTPGRLQTASRERSTAPSVCPVRTKHAASRARSG